jgi:rubredoxin
VRCGFCGYEFDASDAQSSCGACPMAMGCHLVRCPRCGYEMPPEPKLIKWLRTLKRLVSQHKADASDVQIDRKGIQHW